MTENYNQYKKRRNPPGLLVDYTEDSPRRRVEDSWQRYVPKQLFRLLGAGNITGIKLGDYLERKLTILFADIRNFTTLSEQMTTRENFEFINRFLEVMIPVIHNKGGIIDQFNGDAVMALFPGSADQAVSAAIGMLEAAQKMNEKNSTSASPGIGIGLNTGFAMLGVVGNIDRLAITVIGDTVNLASCLETSSGNYRTPLLIGESTLNALEKPGAFHIRFIDRIRVQGKSRPQSVYEVYDNDPEPLKKAKAEIAVRFENALAHYHLENVARARGLFIECAGIAPEDTVTRFYLERCDRYLAGGPHEGTGGLDQDVAWDDSYSVRIPVIDQQHRELLANTNKLSRLVREERQEGLTQMLDFLEEYSLTHFRMEEALMDEYGYPFSREHKQEHNRFIEYYTCLRQEIETACHDRLYLLLKIDIFMVDWLLNHTSGIDKHLGKFLLEAGYHS